MAEKKIIVDVVVNTGDSAQQIQSVAKSEAELAKATDAANKQLAENNNELDKTAQSANDAVKANKSLKAQLRELQQELQKLALAGKQNTEEYINLREQAGELRDAISDVNDEISQAGSDTRGLDQTIRVATTLTAAFTIAEGATALFGKENEELQKTLLKVTAAMSILNGLQEIQAELTRKDSIFTKAATLAKAAYATVVGGATGATKLFRLALAGIGFGIVIAAITALITNFDKIKKAVIDFIPGLGGLQKGFDKTKEVLKGFGDASLNVLTKVVKLLFVIPRTLFALYNEGVSGALRVIKETGVDLVNLFSDAKDAYENGVDAQKKLNAENEKRKKIQDQIEATNKEIIRTEANLQDARILKLKKARLELSLLTQNTTEYFDKLKEVNEIQKSLNDSEKTANENRKKLAEEERQRQELLKQNIKNLRAYSSQFSQFSNDAKDFDGGISGIEKQIKALEALFFQSTELRPAIAAAIEELLRLKQAIEQPIDLNVLPGKILANDAKNAAEELQKLQEKIGHIQLKVKMTAEESAEFAKSNRQRYVEGEQLLLQQISEYSGLVSNVVQQAFAARQQELDNQLKQGLISEKEYSEKVKELKRKEAISNKANAVFNATINGGLAILKGFVDGGVALGAVVAALVAAQIAAIIATPIPKFFKGVIDLNRGIYPAGKDTIPAMLNEGESVMTTQETKKYKTVFQHIRNNTFESKYLPMMAMRMMKVPSMNFEALRNHKSSSSNMNDKKILEELQLLRLMLRENNKLNAKTAENTSSLRNKPIQKRFNV